MTPPLQPTFPDVGLLAVRNGSRLHFTGQLVELADLVDDLFDMADDVDPMMHQVRRPTDADPSATGGSQSINRVPPAPEDGKGASS